MQSNLLAVTRYFFYWLAFFFIERLVFLLFFLEKIQKSAFSEVSQGFLYGLRLDASTVGYLGVLPALGFVLIWNIKKLKLSNKVFRIYIRTLVVICSLICVINLNIYREWGSKVNSRAFEFLFNSPGEAIASSVSSPLFISFSILAILIFTGFYLFKGLEKYKVEQRGSLLVKIPISLLLLGLNFLLIRGGWQLSPINESMSYYSATPILNHAAVNTEWALMRSVERSLSTKKQKFSYFKQPEAQAIVRELYPAENTKPVQVLSTTRPNVVLVLLESYTADVVESLGGEKGINPQMEKLIDEGLLFESIYSSGDRTDKGVIAVLSAFPSQGGQSIIKDQNKHSKLPSIFKTLHQQGYQTAFYYGGESQFTNMKSYFLTNKCDLIVDKADFRAKDMNSKWGAYDEVVYRRLVKDAKPANKPFFAAMLSLTNHEPFELPVPPHFKGEEVQNKFRSTAYYADSCIGAFINDAKKQPWYKNTLFVFVADHGHRLPRDEFDIQDSRRYRIPLLFYGEVIKPEFRGQKISKVGSQVDIASTIFRQMNINATEYTWSKDLLNPSVKGHAFYAWDGGFGFVDQDKEALSFDNISKKVIYRAPEKLKNEAGLLRYAQASMQTIFQKYLDY